MSTRYKRTDWVQRREDYSSGCSSRFGLGRLLLAWLLAGFISSVAYAVPITTNYQGYLENTNSEPLNATVTMTFALYNEGGVSLWTETHQQVEVTNGVFSLILGSITSFENVDLDGKRYLGISVGGDAEMSPRQKLTSGFSAMRAAVAESVKAESVKTDSIANDAVTGVKIKDSTITGAKIADLSGHNVIELDDVADAGSGKIISDAEREKLEGLVSGGTGSSGGSPTFNNVTVEDQLNVKKHLKVGENSIHLTSGGSAPANEIYTNKGPLLIQKNSGDNVGIGTSDPKAKLDVTGIIKASSEPLPANFVPDFGNGIYMRYDDTVIDSGGEIGVIKNKGFSRLFLHGNPILMNATGGENYGIGPNVGIGSFVMFNDDGTVKTVKHPRNRLDVKGSVAIGYNYAGNNTAPADGLAVQGNVGIGLEVGDEPKSKLDVNGDVYTRGDFLMGEQGDRWIFHNWKAYLSITPENKDTNTWDWDKSLILWKNGNVDINGGVAIAGNALIKGADLVLGMEDGMSIGNIPFQRALVHNHSDTLVINYAGDFEGGTEVHSSLTVNGDVYGRKFIHSSDARLKKDIEPIDKSLEKVLNLKGVTFRFKEGSDENKPKEMGFIAQEVEKVIPEVVTTNHEGYKGVDYSKMTAVLVEAIKELKAQNDALKTIVCEDHPEKVICQ